MLVRPRVTVAMGATAARSVLGKAVTQNQYRVNTIWPKAPRPMWLWPRQLHSWYGYRHVSNRRPCQGEADARADSGSGRARCAAKRVQVDVDRRDRRGGRNNARSEARRAGKGWVSKCRNR